MPVIMVLAGLAIVLALAVLLRAGRDLFVPFALASLLGFVLAPGVRALERLGVPGVAAAALSVLVAVGAIGLLALVVGREVVQLAADLPKYETTIKSKIASVRGLVTGTGRFADAVETLRGLAEDGLGPPSDAGTPGRTSRSAPPIPVEFVSEGPGPLSDLITVATPLLQPLATFGVIVIFAVFVLIQREDLRNRLIRLVGTDDLLQITAAIDDGAHRLSLLLLTQLGVNSAYGLIVGTGLWLVGLPNPVLWGVLAGILRFIPYVGATMGAAFPLLLALAIDPGWSMLLWAGLLILAVDVVLAQILEPLFYSHSTGLSPVAVILTTAMWAFLWGPIGLVLAGPLTVCVVVLGRHVDRLRFLDVLLGDRPVLAPSEILYQRLLSADGDAAAEHARILTGSIGLVAYGDDVVMPALRMARRDVRRGSLTAERLATLQIAMRDLIHRLPDLVRLRPGPVRGRPMFEAAVPNLGGVVEAGGSVLCIPDEGAFDEAILLVLAHILREQGRPARILAPEARWREGVDGIDVADVAVVFFSCVEPPSAAHVRLAARRLRRRVPGLRVILGSWSGETLGADLRRSTSADLVVTSLSEAVAGVLRAAPGTAASA